MKKIVYTTALILNTLCSNEISFAQAPNQSGAGNCLTFNYASASTRVEVPSSVNLCPTSAITAECWFNTTQTNINVGIFGKWNFVDADNSCQYTYTMNGGTVYFSIRVTGNVQYNISSPATNYNDGNWHHASATYQNSIGMKLYMDGNLVATNVTATGNILVFTVPLKIGTYAGEGGFNNHFDGKIDEVRIWNVALTQTQIRDNMCKKLIGNEAGLMGYWRFDETTGNTFFDSQTNVPTNNGTGF